MGRSLTAGNSHLHLDLAIVAFSWPEGDLIATH